MKRIALLLFLSAAALGQVASRDRFYSALLDAKVLDPDRELVHLSNTCMLHIDGSDYAVLDLQEIVKSDQSPRGVNRIIVLDPQLKPVKRIDYTSQRPLFCAENRLYIFGDLDVGHVLPEGNVLTFSNHGKTVKVTHVEANAYPVPITRNRKTPPQ